MSLDKGTSKDSGGRAEVAARLASKRPEIERLANEAIARIEPGATADLSRAYADGVKRAVEAVFDYVLASLAAGSAVVEPVPLEALDQARRSAKAGVGLHTVLRRYTAGDRALRRVLTDESVGVDSSIVDDVHNLTDEAIDTVMRNVASEFEAEAARLSTASDPVLVTTLGLLNEEIHVAELGGYVLDRWHVGLVTESAAPTPLLFELAHSLDAQPLVVDSPVGQRWVWIGRNQPMAAAGVEEALTKIVGSGSAFGLGEPRRGLPGWRLTHAEARCAAELPDSDGRSITRMRGHVLEAAVLENQAFAESLIATYIEPLEYEPAKPAADLRRTVWAYLRSGQNAKSAADYLGVDRHTVLRRVRKVEELVGEPVKDCFAQLDTALRIAPIPIGSLRR